MVCSSHNVTYFTTRSLSWRKNRKSHLELIFILKPMMYLVATIHYPGRGGGNSFCRIQIIYFNPAQLRAENFEFQYMFII